MILYFSGTGNSEYVAKRIAKIAGDRCLNLIDKLLHKDYTQMSSSLPWVVVVPTYAWQIPHIVRDWLKNAVLTGNHRIYFVLTCGDDIGNAGYYLKKLCESRDMEFMGCARVVMPENYIALFDTTTDEDAPGVIEKAEPDIEDIAFKIRTGGRLIGDKVKLTGYIKSSLVNLIFYPLFVNSRRFRVGDSCTGCGKCAMGCVTGCITMEDGKPVWGKSCTHCMACICRCPASAIEYGSKSSGRNHYVCPK